MMHNWQDAKELRRLKSKIERLEAIVQELRDKNHEYEGRMYQAEIHLQVSIDLWRWWEKDGPQDIHMLVAALEEELIK